MRIIGIIIIGIGDIERVVIVAGVRLRHCVLSVDFEVVEDGSCRCGLGSEEERKRSPF